MTASVYTIPMCEKENIEKAINRFMKKANAYGKSLTVQYGAACNNVQVTSK